MIRIILWDLDNTLLDPRPPERLAIRKCFKDWFFTESSGMKDGN